MPDPERELEISQWMSLYSERYRNRHLGDPVLNDDGSADSLFDIRFDAADPPVALEVTSIVDPPFIATARMVDRVGDALTRVATEEGLGRWYVEVVAGTRLHRIKQAVLEIIMEGATPPEGVRGVWKADDGEPGVVFFVWSSDNEQAGAPLPGFTIELEEAIQANQAKLARAEGYERHLAVDLKAMRAEDPARAPPPSLPLEIDVSVGDQHDYFWSTVRTNGLVVLRWRVVVVS